MLRVQSTSGCPLRTALLAIGLAACGGDLSTDVCEVMSAKTCFCADGSLGEQVCSLDGTAYSDCECTGSRNNTATPEGSTDSDSNDGQDTTQSASDSSFTPASDASSSAGRDTGTGGMSGGMTFSQEDFQMFIDMCMENPDGMFCQFFNMGNGDGDGDGDMTMDDGGI